MATFGFVEYNDATPEVKAVYDDIMATCKTDWINNFWKGLAHDPALLKRTWNDVKHIMAPGAFDPLVKKLIYLAVSVTNGCPYCIAAHTVSARNKGMSEANVPRTDVCGWNGERTQSAGERLSDRDRRGLQDAAEIGFGVNDAAAEQQ
jgi:AhpD family alkylhydroperoxidase